MKIAVFIDTMSIQKYIFASNFLKENIGASYNVKKMFDDLEKNFIKQKCYIGGGNALLLFDSIEKAKKEMKEWTKTILTEFPGITPIVTIEENFDESKFSESRKYLMRENLKNKNRNIPLTILQSFGITKTCTRTGLSSEVFYDNFPNSEGKYISSVSYTKLKNVEMADEGIAKKYADILNNQYKFTNELGELGGTAGENDHIAIVHIDGNDMGEILMKFNGIEEIRVFSESMKEATDASFKAMISTVIEDYSEIKKVLTLNNNTLPVRPIVIGGDDITFVCDARIGFYLSEIFMEAFEKQKICGENKITCCAGISIVKTKYPFYRAYSIAEELCSNAKQKRIELKELNDSMWDFHISFGGLSGSLNEIRETEYETSGLILYRRPYKLGDFNKLKQNIQDIAYDEDKKLPKTKIHRLREVLYQGKDATKEFIKELDFRNRSLPFFENSKEAKDGFVNEVTPYIDLIEMIDFFPEFYLNKKQEVSNG